MVVTVAVVGPARCLEIEPAARVLGGTICDDRDSARAAWFRGRSLHSVSDVIALVNSMPPPTVEDCVEFLRWYGWPFNPYLCWMSRGKCKLVQCGNVAAFRVGNVAVCRACLMQLCRDCEVEPTVSMRVLSCRRYNGFTCIQRVRLVPVGRR